VTHGQCDVRPTVTFLASEHYQGHRSPKANEANFPLPISPHSRILPYTAPLLSLPLVVGPLKIQLVPGGEL